MQQINTEEQQTNVRLPRQLPANIIKQTTLPIHQKHVNKNSPLVKNPSDKLIRENQQQSPSRPLKTDLGDFDTHRSLSSCPTYSSLSRQSRETRECATQITTLTPVETTEDNQEILDDSSLPIDNNQAVLFDEIPVEEVELMPISSGYGYYPYNYPTTRTSRIAQPQIVARANQFRDNQRNKNQNGFNVNSKTKSNGKPSPTRPTAVKGSPHSDTYVFASKQNEINSKVPKTNLEQNGFRRIPPKETVVRSSSPVSEIKRSESIHKNGVTRPVKKYVISPPTDSEDLGRKPLRLANKSNRTYYPSPPAYYQKPAPLPREALDRPQRMRVANNEYVVQRRRQPPSDQVYDDYHQDSPIERTRPQRVVRVLREAPYREEEEDDDVYYVEPAPRRRIKVVRRPPPPPTEYVYVDEAPAQIRRRRPSRRPEVVYVDDDQPVQYEDEYIYVDEDGNEVQFVDDDQKQSPSQHVEYIYDDQIDKRRKSKVIYVEDDAPINQGRDKKKSKQPSSTRIVYE